VLNAFFFLAMLTTLGTPASPAGPTLPVARVSASSDAFDRLLARWALVVDYAVTMSTFEASGTKTAHSILHYSFRKPDRAKIEVVGGTNRGAVLVWDGGNDVTAYKRGMFSIVKLHLGLEDGRVKSLRGNGILTPELGDTLACFRLHRQAVETVPGPDVAGEPTETIELHYGGFTCANDSSADSDVTRDLLDVSQKTGEVVRRERYAGTTLVESYDLHDLTLNPGLADGVFQ